MLKKKITWIFVPVNRLVNEAADRVTASLKKGRAQVIAMNENHLHLLRASQVYKLNYLRSILLTFMELVWISVFDEYKWRAPVYLLHVCKQQHAAVNEQLKPTLLKVRCLILA